MQGLQVVFHLRLFFLIFPVPVWGDCSFETYFSIAGLSAIFIPDMVSLGRHYQHDCLRMSSFSALMIVLLSLSTRVNLRCSKTSHQGRGYTVSLTDLII
jgi:hypothetical protein